MTNLEYIIKERDTPISEIRIEHRYPNLNTDQIILVYRELEYGTREYFGKFIRKPSTHSVEAFCKWLGKEKSNGNLSGKLQR